MAVKLNARTLESQGVDRWYVTDGTNAVGPVRLDLLVRGVESGRVPLDSFLRHEGWRVWRPVGEFAVVIDDGTSNSGRGSMVPTVRGMAMLEEMVAERRIAEGLVVEGRPAGDLVTEDLVAEGLVAEDTAVPNTAAEGSVWSPTEPDDVEARAVEPAPAASRADAKSLEAARSSGERVALRAELSSQRSAPRTPLGGERAGLDSMLDDEETILRDVSQPSQPPPRPAAPAASTAPPRPAAPAASTAPPRPATPPSPSAPPRPSAAPSPSVPPRPSAPPARISALPAPLPSADRLTALPITVSSTQDSPASVQEDFEGAQNLGEGLLWLLGSAVQLAAADGGLAHRVSDDGAMVACARGPEVAAVLGMSTRLLDPVLVAAAGGHVVLAEPVPGPAGDAIHGRMRRMGLEAEGALMIPIRPRDRLLAFLELGARARFSLANVAKVESLVRAFVRRAEAAGWA